MSPSSGHRGGFSEIAGSRVCAAGIKGVWLLNQSTIVPHSSECG